MTNPNEVVLPIESVLQKMTKAMYAFLTDYEYRQIPRLIIMNPITFRKLGENFDLVNMGYISQSGKPFTISFEGFKNIKIYQTLDIAEDVIEVY